LDQPSGRTAYITNTNWVQFRITLTLNSQSLIQDCINLINEFSQILLGMNDLSIYGSTLLQITSNYFKFTSTTVFKVLFFYIK